MREFNTIQWEQVDLEKIKEIIRLAELHMSDQLASSFSRDQRLAAILTALSTISIAGFGALGAIIKSSSNVDWPMILSISAGIVTSLTGALFALKGLRSTKFYFSGSSPDNWFDAEDIHENIKISLAHQAKYYAEMIQDNEKNAQKAGKNLNLSIIYAFCTPVSLIVVWVLIQLLLLRCVCSLVG